MDKLKSKPEFSGKSLKVVIGADLVPWLSLWDEGERLKSDNEFIVFSRGNRVIDPQDMPPKSRTVKETFITDLSSTLLRERIKLAKDRYPEDTTLGLLGLIPKSVRKYISEHNLYV